MADTSSTHDLGMLELGVSVTWHSSRTHRSSFGGMGGNRVAQRCGKRTGGHEIEIHMWNLCEIPLDILYDFLLYDMIVNMMSEYFSSQHKWTNGQMDIAVPQLLKKSNPQPVPNLPRFRQVSPMNDPKMFDRPFRFWVKSSKWHSFGFLSYYLYFGVLYLDVGIFCQHNQHKRHGSTRWIF